MSANVKISNGDGGKNTAEVTKDRALVVSNLTYPAFGSQLTKPLNQYLTLDGTPSGTSNMSVDGSVTYQDFYISADDDNDRYISQLNFLLGYGATGALYKWADGTALTNGIRIFYTSIKGENNLTLDLKTNSDMLRTCVGDFLYNNWESRNFAAVNDYGYIGTIDLAKKIPNLGIKLDRGSNQKLIVRIRDDLTGIADVFNFEVSGFERFEL